MNIYYDVTGHTQVRLSGLQELGREEGGPELIAHIRDIKESAGSRQLDMKMLHILSMNFKCR